MPCPDLAAVLPVADGGGLSLVLGAYGALVSTLLAALQLLRDRPGVKLRLTPTNVEYAPETETDDALTRDFWEDRVVNHRKRPITIRRDGLLGDRGQHVNARIVDPYVIGEGRPNWIEPFPKMLTDGTSFAFFFELDFRRDRDQMSAYVVDDLDFRVYLPSFSPRRRYAEWTARRRFEKAIGGKASLIGDPPPVLSEIWMRPTEGRPTQDPGKHREPTPAGRAPASLAA